MANRTAAEIFGKVFNYLSGLRELSQIEREDIYDMIEWLYELSKEYDFTPDQMRQEEVMVKLGLATKDPNVNDGYPVYKE